MWWRNIVAIKDGDTYLFAGPITNTSLQGFSDVDGSVGVECIGYLGMLKDRYTDAVRQYTSTDAGAIVIGNSSSLINYTQSKTNGHLGISKGSITTTTDRDRTYEYKNILEAIMDLTKVDGGFDFDFTYGKSASGDLDKVYLNIYSNKGSYKSVPTLEVGVNVQTVSIMSDKDIINQVDAVGAGNGEGVITYSVGDSTSQTGYTRREQMYVRKDISIPDTLQNHAKEIVRLLKVDNYVINVEMIDGKRPVLGEVDVGDIVDIELKAGSGYLNFKGQASIMEYGVNIGGEGEKHVSYKLSFSG